MCSADVLSENPACLMPGCGSFPEAWVATSLAAKALGEVTKGSELSSELSTSHLGTWLTNYEMLQQNLGLPQQ